jgi:hypothetical protein
MIGVMSSRPGTHRYKGAVKWMSVHTFRAGAHVFSR